MTDGHFEDFAEAVARQARPALVSAHEVRRITVLGGGADARMLAALALAESFEVTLFSAYGEEMDAIRAAGVIALRDAGPLGTYQIDRGDAPSIRTTMELDRAVVDAEVIFMTGPIHKQRTYAMGLADHLRDGQMLVLAPGRTFGALEATWLLRVGGAKADVTIIEAGGLPFWYTAEGARLSLSAAGPVHAASLPGSSSNMLSALEKILPNLKPAISPLHASFADGSGVVEVPTLLLGGPLIGDGRPAVPMGGVALAENESFRNLIGEKHRAVIEALAQERVDVARQFGVRDLPSADEWLDIHAGAPKGDGSRPIPSHAEAESLLRDATIGSLVPLSSAAKVTGRAVPATEAMIMLASSVLGADIGSAGRRLDAIGIEAGGIDDIRRIMDGMIMAEPARAER